MACNSPPTTRLAPSPTGAMHLGNARSFLINWALAKQQSQRIVLRIEDIDSPRVKDDADRQTIEILNWLGMDWDAGPTYQLGDLAPYQAALAKLQAAGVVYPCTCSRREILAAQSAPHGDEHELRYPGTCRLNKNDATPPPGLVGDDTADRNALEGDAECAPERAAECTPGGTPDSPPTAAAWRVIVPDEAVSFADEFCGPQSFNIQEQVGDFIVARKDGLPAYQLAVVVDDARQGVSHVVRGDDLLRSTARQVLLYKLLDLGLPPHYLHLPLVLGPDGRRLAKRHGDSRISTYRKSGCPPHRIIGLLAFWSGVIDQREPISADQFADKFQLEKLSHKPVTMTDADEAFLGRP
jgi:glutamyl-tRNA synthetase